MFKPVIITRIFTFFNDLKLMQKLLLSYIILIIFPLMLLSYLIYDNVSKIIEDHIVYSAKQAFEQSNSFLTYKFYNITEKSNVLLNNNLFIQIMSSDSNSSLSEQVKNSMDLSLFLTSLEDEINITNVKLFVSDNYLYSNDGKNIFGLKTAENAKWYSTLMKSNKSFLWAPAAYLNPQTIDTDAASAMDKKKEMLTYAKKIILPNDYSKSVGAIRFDFPKSSITDILCKSATIDDSLSYIQCSNGDIFAASSDTLLKKYRMTHEQFAKSLAADTWTFINLNNEKVLTTCRPIENTDLAMVIIIPFGSLLQDSKNIQNLVLVLLFIIGTIAYIVAYFLSYSITKRIKILAAKMYDMHNGKLVVADTRHGKDEIGGLIEDYNYMVVKMVDLIEEQYKSGQKVKSAELKILHSQINPHFLYNTLDMINWYALKKTCPEIVSIVNALAKFYKLSLNKGNEIIPLKDEIAHVQCYFQIQSYRYKHIKLEIDVSEDLMNYTIPKIVLQPIIENSILHGILCRDDKTGIISISGKLEDDCLMISITDNGIGMTKEIVENLLSGKIESKAGGGFGVKNTQERLQLHYGSIYGLTFSSEINIGTTVIIKIPAQY